MDLNLRKEDIQLNGTTDYFAPQPAPVRDIVKYVDAVDDAYFAVQNLSKDMDASLLDASQMSRNLATQGYDDLVEKAKVKVTDETRVEIQQSITNLISDPTVDKTQKMQLLRDYTTFDIVEGDLRQQYATDAAILDNSESLEEQDAQDVYVDDINMRLAEAAQIRDENDADDALEDIGGEVVSIANLIPASIAGVADFGVRIYDAIKQKMDKGEVDWVENYTASERLEPGVIKSITEWKLDSVAEYLGIKEDFETSYTNRIFGSIGEKLEAAAEYSVEKGLFKNKEQAMFTMEAVGSLIPAGIAGKKAIRNIKHRANGGADVTTKANPKKAGDDLTKAITEEGDKTAKELNTSKEAIVAENVLPKAGKGADEIIPDIGERLDDITDINQLSKKDRLVFETFFDDNIARREQRFDDRNTRIKVMKDARLTQNVASSQIDMDMNSLSGRIVFSKTPDYAYTKKKDIIADADKLQKLADEADRLELKKDKDLGIDTKEADVRNRIMVRDQASKQDFTLDEFKAMKLDGRKFQLVYNFKKKYNFMADEMLGQKLNDSGVSLLGNKKIAQFLNSTSLGEYAFGTGFSAKWFEQARASLGGKAGRIKKEIHQTFRSKLTENKGLRDEIAQVINEQARQRADIIDRRDLAKMFRGYSQKQLDAIDDVQKAFREAQNQIEAVNNHAARLELTRNGFNKGYYHKGEYAFATKEIGKGARAEFESPDMMVYDPIKNDFVKFEMNKANQEGIFSMDGRKVMRMENNSIIKNRKGNAISDYVLVKESDIDILPSKVLDHIDGYMQREYKGKIFVERIPKSMIINGKRVDNTTQAGRDILKQYKETIGVASTKAEGTSLKDRLMGKDDAKDFEYGVRNSSIDDIRDVTDEYQQVKEVYQSTKTRNLEMELGEDVLHDPLIAMERSVNRAVNTGAYSMYDKAFKKAFERDFKDVLPDTNGRYPDSVGQIKPKVEGDVKAQRLADEAKQLWRRQQHFQGVPNKKLDAYTQNAMHYMADVFEKMNIPGISKKGSIIAREVGDLGLSGIQQKVMGFSGTLYITFSAPFRQAFIQPMMWLEQQMIYPKSFPKTMSRMPMHVLGLLHQDNALLRGTYNAYVKKLSKKDKADFLAEQAAMKQQGVLESVNLHLAMEDTLKARITKLDPKQIEKLAEPGAATYGAVKGLFNKYGFSNAELMNRVGLWLQNKYRWVDDPRNVGKNWADVRNANEIGFEAWKQSGSMTRAGAVGFQRAPLLAFLTQFQSIGLKSLMNVVQDNATNLTRADRIKLVGTRMVMHGMEFGAPIAAGKFLIDYMEQHEDPEVREAAKTISDGVVDRVFQNLTETDLSLSQSSSVANVNFFGDLLSEMMNAGLWIAGSEDAQAPNIPSVKAIGRTFEKVNDVKNMFIYNPITPELLVSSVARLSEITSAGNTWGKAMDYLTNEQILTKDGRRTGIDVNQNTAYIKAFTGFQTREELNQWKIKEVQRDEGARIQDAVDHYNQVILSQRPTDMAEAIKYINMSLSKLEQTKTFDVNQMYKIKKGIINAQRKKFGATQENTIHRWIYSLDPESKERRQAINRLKDHKDEKIQEAIKIIEGLQ